ncbi:MAG: heme ABC transporter ATP-binding protein [Bacteroidetes bacterium]|nr:heme ABC transporter ATP-binding protein [Bacteroidota bacterium]
MAFIESEKSVCILIEASNISYSIKGKVLLDKVNISIPNGKIVGLAGINGAGKSTLLKVLIGQLEHYRGTVKYDQTDLKQLNITQLAGLRAVLPQEVKATFPVIAKDIIELGRMFFNEEETVKQGIINQVIEEVKANNFIHQYYDSLSGGEKQRIQLARVLSQIWLGENCRYLFLDEPISSLDIALQHEILRMLNKVKQRNIGVLIVLHDINLLLQYCDEICFLKNGEVITQDTPEIVANEKLLSNIYNFPMSIHELNGKPYLLPKSTNQFIEPKNI